MSAIVWLYSSFVEIDLYPGPKNASSGSWSPLIDHTIFFAGETRMIRLLFRSAIIM